MRRFILLICVFTSHFSLAADYGGYYGPADGSSGMGMAMNEIPSGYTGANAISYVISSCTTNPNKCENLKSQLDSTQLASFNEIHGAIEGVSATDYTQVLKNLENKTSNPMTKLFAATNLRFSSSNDPAEARRQIDIILQNDEKPDPYALALVIKDKTPAHPWTLCNLAYNEGVYIKSLIDPQPNSYGGYQNGYQSGMGLGPDGTPLDSGPDQNLDKLVEIVNSKFYLQDERCFDGESIKNKLSDIAKDLSRSKNPLKQRLAITLSNALKGTGVVSSVSPAASAAKPCFKNSDSALMSLAQYCQSASAFSYLLTQFKRNKSVVDVGNFDATLTGGGCTLKAVWDVTKKVANAKITVLDVSGNEVKTLTYKQVPLEQYESYLATAAGQNPQVNSTNGVSSKNKGK